MVVPRFRAASRSPQLSDVLLDAVLHDLGAVAHLPEVAVDTVR